MENQTHVARLGNPMIALEAQAGLVVIDEIQRMPALFEVLRVLSDQSTFRGKFLVLGSASPTLVKGVSESLAGRVGFVDLGGFSIEETAYNDFRQLWIRGGFPLSYLARTESASYRWRENFIRTFLERDIPQLGITIPAAALRRFWTMTAHYHGQVLNLAEFARALGSAEGTARRYLDILFGAYMVRQLPPYYANLKKRQVKAPKIYIRDSGILHTLLTLESGEDLAAHPKLGASFEGFVVEEICRAYPTENLYFWATHSGAELDLLLISKGKTIGFEIKFTEIPKVTKSMRIAMEDLALHHLYIVYPGTEGFALDEKISVLPVAALDDTLDAIRNDSRYH